MRRPSDRLNFNLRVDHARQQVAHAARLVPAERQRAAEARRRQLRSAGSRATRGRRPRACSGCRRAVRCRGCGSPSRACRSGARRTRARLDVRSADRSRARRVHVRRRAGRGRPRKHRRRVRDRHRLRAGAAIRCGWGRSSRAAATAATTARTISAPTRFRASPTTRPAGRRTTPRAPATRWSSYSQWQAGLLLPGRLARAARTSRSARACARSSRRTCRTSGTSRRAAASRGRRSRTARRRSAPAADSSTTGSSRRSTSRRSASTASGSRIASSSIPGYPDPFGGGASQEVLPPSKYMLADGIVMPKRAVVLFAVTQQLSPTFSVNASYSHHEGWDRFRGRNVNAPLRRRPARSRARQRHAGRIDRAARVGLVQRRHELQHPGAAHVPLRELRAGTTSATTPTARSACRPTTTTSRPSGAAPRGVPRHIASAVLNTTLTRNLRLGVSTAARSGAPYTVTTGRDDNGDTVFNDRPAGTPRNSVTGAAMWDVAARLTYAFGFGERPPSTAAPGGQMVVIADGRRRRRSARRPAAAAAPRTSASGSSCSSRRRTCSTT